jgi:uncharacterized protein
MTDLFLHIYRFLKHRIVLRSFLFFGSLIFFVFFASKLKMEEDITGFMPKDPQSERINFIFKNIAVSDKIILRFGAIDTTGSVDKDLLISAAERFSVVFDSITGGKKLVNSVLYKIDSQKFLEISDFIVKNIPFFLEDTDYPRIDSLLTSEKIKTLLESNKKLLVSPAGMVLKANLVADPLHLSGHVISKLKDFQVNRQYEIYNDYIFSKKKTDLLCFITVSYPVSATAKNAELVQCLDQAVTNVQQSFRNNLKITYFGAAPVAVTNATQIKRDTLISIIISVVLILLLLGWFFRSGRALLLITFPVVFGTVMSLAALFFIKGSISAIAIGAGSIILGIAINYSLHFMVHLKHEPDSEKTLKEIASPMTIGSITTIGAFLSLLFISADAMRDFGLFASFTLLGTLLFVLIFLPHFSKLPQKHDRPVFERISDFRLGKTKLIMLVLILLTLVFFFFSGNVTFDSDMNKINYMKPEQRKAFNELSSVSTVGQKGVYLFGFHVVDFVHV